MKLEMFFEKFDQFADASDALAKMRELVRNLAVRGKLVSQDPDDKPAEDLIARIAAIRHAKRAKQYAPVAPDEVPYEIPFSWAWVRLGNISLTSDSGWSPQCLPQARSGTDWGVLKVSAVSWGVFKPDENKALPPGMASRPDCEVKAGDFLLSRANTEELVARSVVVDQTPPRLMMSDKIVRFTFPDEIERAFINLANTTDPARAYYARNASGTSSSMKNIGREAMCNLPIPLPPLTEQRRIVAKVDELMALCDRLEAHQQERETRHAALARASLARFADAPTPDSLDFLLHNSFTIAPADLRKAILTLAVQGKLVEPDPTEEPVDDLLARMEKRRHHLIEAKKIRKPRDLPPVAEDEPPFSVPAGWRWTRWGQICDWITYGFTRPMAHVETGPPIVTAKNVQDGYMTFENAHHADASEFADLNPKDLPRKGDILITKDGTIGRAAIVDTEEPFCINQSVAVLWLESCLLYRPFMLMVIRSPFAQGPIWEAAEGMAIKHLSITDFGTMILPLPPLAEQRRIVAKVEQLMALVDALETQLTAFRRTGANLMEAVVAELTAKA